MIGLWRLQSKHGWQRFANINCLLQLFQMM